MKIIGMIIAMVILAIGTFLLGSLVRALAEALGRLGTSRGFDLKNKDAAEEGVSTSPERLRQQLGCCRDCGGPVATHGYELALESAATENPQPGQVLRRFFLLCEGCYWKANETVFWVNCIRQVGCLVQVLGLLLALLGFALLDSKVVGGIGAFLFVGLWLLTGPAKKAREMEVERLLKLLAPDETWQAVKHVEPKPSWFETPLELMVPVAVAVIVPDASPLRAIGLDDLGKVLRHELKTWALLGAPHGHINLHLADLSSTTPAFAALVREIAEGEPRTGREPVEGVKKILELVAEDPQGLGVVPAELLLGDEGKVRALLVEGQECRRDNDAYPLWAIRGEVGEV